MSAGLTGRGFFLIYCLGDFNLKGWTRIHSGQHVFPTNILLQTQPWNPWLLASNPLRSPQLHNKANAMCKQKGFKQNVEKWQLHKAVRGSSQRVPLMAFWGSRPVRGAGGPLGPRKQLADTTWQYSLGLCSFPVASGRVPGITLCTRDGRARCPRLRDKNICWSHRVVGRLSSPTENVGGSWQPGRFQDVSRPCEGRGKLPNPSPKFSQRGNKCESFPISSRK